jgi:hypothetical protein
MRDECPKDVQRVLAQRVANRCSNPDRRAITSGPQEDESKAVNLGVAAHITAASPGGPRPIPLLVPVVIASVPVVTSPTEPERVDWEEWTLSIEPLGAAAYPG